MENSFLARDPAVGKPVCTLLTSKNWIPLEHRDGHDQFLICSPLKHQASRRAGSSAPRGNAGVKYSFLLFPLPRVLKPFQAAVGSALNSQLKWEGGDGEGRIGHAKWKWFINENIVLFVEGRVNFARTPLRLC